MGKVIHFRNKCIGCGICFEMQPDLWRMSKKDGKATLVGGVEKKGIFQLELLNSIPLTKVVAGACPVKIIQVV